VWQTVAADMETPVSAYLKLCGQSPYSFLLESVEGGAVLGRYSVIGFAPDFIWRSEKTRPQTLDSLKKAIADSKIDDVPAGLPPMAASGLFGYLGYDTVRMIEDIPDKNPDTINVPESILIRPTILAIFDNVKNQLCFVTPVYDHAKNSKQSAAD